MVDIKWDIGDVVRKLRKIRRWNQLRLAKAVGVNKATIVRVENADPKVSRDTYLKVADALGISMAELELLVPDSSKETQRAKGGGSSGTPPAAAGSGF